MENRRESRVENEEQVYNKSVRGDQTRLQNFGREFLVGSTA
jgi:hypothetical protein